MKFKSTQETFSIVVNWDLSKGHEGELRYTVNKYSTSQEWRLALSSFLNGYSKGIRLNAVYIDD